MAASMVLNGCRGCLVRRLYSNLLSVTAVQVQCQKNASGRSGKKKQTGPKEKVYQTRASQEVKVEHYEVIEERQETPEWLAKKPVDRIYRTEFFPPVKFSFEEAVAMHREFADPVMMDNMDSILYANMNLNMATKKKTKFMRKVRGLIEIPHLFDTLVKRNIVVFCKTEEEQELALKLGAVHAGSDNLVAEYKDQLKSLEEVDHVLCTPEMFAPLAQDRTVFRELLPSKKDGSLGSDIAAMMKFHTESIYFESSKVTDEESWLQIPVGVLSMPMEELTANFLAEIAHITGLRSSKLGDFITRMEVVAPPSKERFRIEVKQYLPGHEPKITKEEALYEDEEKEAQAS